MYIDHHTTRRTLETFAEGLSISKIALGLHANDLVAGMLNEWSTGYMAGNILMKGSRPIFLSLPISLHP